MIKLSKDNLFIQSRMGPLALIFIHAAVVNVLIKLDLTIGYLSYVSIVLLHFFLTAFWRRFLLSDVYINDKLNEISFISLNGAEETYGRQQIINVKTYIGITKVSVVFQNQKVKKYFTANSRDNLNYLADGSPTPKDSLDSPGIPFDKLTAEILKKNKKLFFVPLIMFVLAITGYLFNGTAKS